MIQFLLVEFTYLEKIPPKNKKWKFNMLSPSCSECDLFVITSLTGVQNWTISTNPDTSWLESFKRGDFVGRQTRCHVNLHIAMHWPRKSVWVFLSHCSEVTSPAHLVLEFWPPKLCSYMHVCSLSLPIFSALLWFYDLVCLTCYNKWLSI